MCLPQAFFAAPTFELQGVFRLLRCSEMISSHTAAPPLWLASKKRFPSFVHACNFTALIKAVEDEPTLQAGARSSCPPSWPRSATNTLCLQIKGLRRAAAAWTRASSWPRRKIDQKNTAQQAAGPARHAVKLKRCWSWMGARKWWCRREPSGCVRLRSHSKKKVTQTGRRAPQQRRFCRSIAHCLLAVPPPNPLIILPLRHLTLPHPIGVAEHRFRISHASFSHRLPFRAGTSHAAPLLLHHIQLGRGRPPKQLLPPKWLTSDLPCSSAFPTRTEAGKKCRQRHSQNGKLRLCALITLFLAAQ